MESMKYFVLPNLSSREAAQVDTVEKLNALAAEEFPPDKQSFNEWKARADTRHAFYNCTEGLTPSLRVDTDNPSKFLHGFVVEFDSDIDEAMVAKIPNNGVAGLLPTWVSRSRFRNGRKLVFEFVEPVFVDNPEIAERFLKALAKEAKVKNLLPGLDENCYKLTQYQELGIDWKKIGEPIKSELLSSIFFKAASQKVVTNGELEIPLERVAEEVERRWKGRWPGSFTEGTRGPLFWVDPYVDRTGCQVGQYGMICYSDRAGKSFCTWRDILGAEFVRNYESACIGKSIEGIWFDNEKYWVKLESGRWAPNKKEDIASDLKIRNNLKQPQVEEALSVVRNTRRVVGTFPFIHNKNDVVADDSGALYLNTSIKKVIQPASEDGEFPWIKEWIDKVWIDPHDLQRDTFLAWHQRLYASSLQGDMKAGQAIVLAGGVGIGKTLFSRKVIAASVGGFADATSFLLDKTGFNKSCAENACWCIDDNYASTDFRDHDAFSNAIKKYCANPQIPYHAKYKDEELVTWRGRMVITCNLDKKSLSILPDVDDSIKDKIMLFVLAGEEVWMPDFTDIENRLRLELPFYLRWLLNWQAPAHVLGSYRYGVKEYHHPILMEEVRDAAPHGLLAEMLPYAIKHGLVNDKNLKQIEKTATEVYAMMDIPGLRGKLPKFGGNRLGIALSRLGKPWVLGIIPASHGQPKKYILNLDLK
jgi:hypothetical protein